VRYSRQSINSALPMIPPSSLDSFTSPAGTSFSVSARSSGVRAAWIKMRPRRSVGHTRTSTVFTPWTSRVAHGCRIESAYCVGGIGIDFMARRQRRAGAMCLMFVSTMSPI
jgi:hypothetical protein